MSHDKSLLRFVLENRYSAKAKQKTSGLCTLIVNSLEFEDFVLWPEDEFKFSVTTGYPVPKILGIDVGFI